VQVPRDREAEARELLAELLEPETRPPGEGEDEVVEPGETA
jgi:plasmid stability protein